MQCSVYVATSVDGFVAGPNDELAWLDSVESAGEDYGYKAFMDTVDVLVMGRRSYQVVLGFPEWRYAGTRVCVLSKSLQRSACVTAPSSSPALPPSSWLSSARKA